MDTNSQRRETQFYNRFVKRGIDLVLSALIMLVLSPLFLILVIAVKLDSKGPVFFQQKRMGRNRSTFYILKFRTMRVDAPHDVPTHLLQDADRYITRVGNFLRKTSLDELPQLWNIFVGQMSFVGPRPALWNQSDLVEAREQYRANSVRPGLTGWAQINGRDELEIPVKAKLDGEYVSRLSFAFDLKCFLGTFSYVLTRRGVVEGGTGTLGQTDAGEGTGVETDLDHR